MLFLFICNVFLIFRFSYIVDTLKLCIFLCSIFLKLSFLNLQNYFVIFSSCFSNFLLLPAFFSSTCEHSRYPLASFPLLSLTLSLLLLFLLSLLLLRLFPSLVVRSPAYAVNIQVVLSRVSLNKVKCWLVQNTCKDYEEHVK